MLKSIGLNPNPTFQNVTVSGLIALAKGALSSGTASVASGASLALPNTATAGTYLVLLYSNNLAPVAIFAVSKSSPASAGTVATLVSQAGTSFYAGNVWSITYGANAVPALSHNYGGTLTANYVILGAP